MSQTTSAENKRRRGLLIAAALLIIALALAAGVWFFRQRQSGRPDAGFTHPLIRTEGAGTFAAASPAGAGRAAATAAKLQIRLSEGQAVPELVQAEPPVTGEPLSEAEIAQILERLPELTGDAGDSRPFNLPDSSLPPPRPGQTITQTFPPPPADALPPAAPAGPLAVLRYTPEGEIGLAPFLNVTFNQPMVPLTNLESLSAEEVPVTLTPAIPGVWQWVSPQTLRFEAQPGAADRLPMATDFVAEIPAGTESATGAVLAETVRWTFSTPPVQLVTSYPATQPQPLEPVIFIAFDQLIDPASVLATIQVTANNQPWAMRLATAAEIAAGEEVSRLVEETQEGYWLALHPDRPFPADAAINVTISPGTPSAEGPRLTAESQSFSFNTYPPLQIVRHTCSWYERECPPLVPFILGFSNPLDPEHFVETMIRIEPELPGATVNLSGNTLTIQGMTSGRTTYRVTVDGALQDVFGQTLGENETVRFEVGTAVPFVTGPDEILVTLDPSAGEPELTFYVMNYDEVHVQVYAVTLADWPAYTAYRRNFDQGETAPTPPGRLVLDEMFAIENEADVLTETAVNLGEILDGNSGHLVVVIQPPGPFKEEWERRQQTIHPWVQATQIGLDALSDNDELIVWATALRDGSPLANVTVSAGSAETLTGATGLARLPIPAAGVPVLVARQGADTAILPYSPYYWDETGWRARPLQDEMRWHVFDDRSMYRPGEEVHLKGWLRHVNGENGAISLPGDLATGVGYQVYDPQGNEIGSGNAGVNAFGGFDLAFTLPENSNLGPASVNLQVEGGGRSLSGADFYHQFQIQEFRRPEFEVVARQESSGPYLVNGQATLAVAASYFAGGPLPNAEVNWTVTSTPGHYAPPGWPDFTFGEWIPWWFDYGYMDYGYPIVEPVYDVMGFPRSPDQVVESFSGVTNAAGEHYLQIDFEAMEGNRPFSVNAQASVMDVNRQAWAASTDLLVHPASLYVGLRSERAFVEQGDPLQIEAIVTGIDGNAVAGVAVQMQAARLEWTARNGQWLEEAVDVQECTITATSEPVACTFNTDTGGTYEITATIADDQGRPNQSRLTRWVSGGSRPAQRNVEHENLTLIPDHETYQPGDVAEILVQSPFSPAEGLLTLSHGGILSSEPFRLENGSATLRIPITEAHIPSLSLHVDVVGAAARTGDQGEELPGVPPRPAYAGGTLSLNVPPTSRELSLAIAPLASQLEPGAETAVAVTVTDAAGQPVSGAEVALVVVDEAILALTNYQLANPLDTFYRPLWSRLEQRYGRDTIILANPETLAGEQTVEITRVVSEAVAVEGEAAAPEMPMPMATAAPGMTTLDLMLANQEAPPTPIEVRTNFDPLAVFAPTAQTDTAGQAQVTFTLPDNLTRYRIMVAAVAGDRHFGAAESNLTARLPLMVRPAAPRFLNFGDHFELPVVLQNQTGEALVVDVAIQATNLALTGVKGRRVTIPANDRVEVRFPATTMSAGTARFQVAAVSGPYADAATVELPVYTPATTEAFAAYGVLDAGAVAQPFVLPTEVITGYGGLEISTSSTALQALTDAVLYLTSHRYESSEEVASRILTVAALRDVLAAFAAGGLPEPAELEAAVLRDLETLRGIQNEDGGFPYWERGRESIPFHSIHVAHALVLAQQKGFDLPAEMAGGAQTYLQDIEAHFPAWYSRETRWGLSAYALYVRHLAGDSDAAKARNLLRQAGLENLPLEATAWLWPVLATDPAGAADVAAIRQHIGNRAVETAGAANFTTSYGDGDYLMLHSDRRTDGVILNTLVTQDAQNDLIPKIVNGLLAHRSRNGHWRNSQENVFILLALDNYFNTFEAQTPDFVARIWLGNVYAGEHAFAGRTTVRYQTEIPMSYLASDAPASGPQDLILGKEGEGRLYYRLGLHYAPADLSLDPLNRGFVVQRTYEAVDNPEDVRQDESGAWHVRLGARVRVRLTMVADNRRYHVALVDPLPAGLEAINPALAVSESVPEDPSAGPTPYWWWGTWYDHQNVRDERVEAFSTLLWEGVYDYEYVARATTPGTFVTPPAKAEEMYAPEVFGRSRSDMVIIE